MQPLLRRDAPPDKAGAAGTILLDEGNREPKVVRVKGCCVSAGTAANYDDVVQIRPFDEPWRPRLVAPGVTLTASMQTRWLLIASAILAFVIVGAAAVWFFTVLI